MLYIQQVELPLKSLSDVAISHFPLGDHVHELDSTQQDMRKTKILEPEHRSSPSLDRPMVLFDDVVQVL
jgi:hypothetical protein